MGHENKSGIDNNIDGTDRIILLQQLKGHRSLKARALAAGAASKCRRESRTAFNQRLLGIHKLYRL